MLDDGTDAIALEVGVIIREQSRGYIRHFSHMAANLPVKQSVTYQPSQTKLHNVTIYVILVIHVAVQRSLRNLSTKFLFSLTPLFLDLHLLPLYIQCGTSFHFAPKTKQKKIKLFEMCPSDRSVASKASRSSYLGVDFRSAFDVLDADRDGKISKEDLVRFYSGYYSHGVVEATDDFIGSMMTVADFNKDGFVQYDEFERILARRVKKDNKSSCNGVIEDVFKVMDRDGDGKLSYDDVKSYMQLAGFNADDDDIKAMIKLGSGGSHEDGVSFDDLIKILSLEF